MQLRTISNADISGKNVLLRVDFNVNLKHDDIREAYKMRAAKKTIDALLVGGAKTISLLTHLGRPDGNRDESASLSKLIDDVERELHIHPRFLDDCVGEIVSDAVKNAENGAIFLLENVRFHKEEEQNDEAFSRLLAKPFDVFVNDAFSVCHRAHTSTVGITSVIPSYAGLRLAYEFETLSAIRSGVESPSVGIVGGSKIATKLPLIELFSRMFTTVLVGGKVANEAIDEHIALPENVFLPEDFEGDRLDIGKQTRKRFVEAIRSAKTVVWNGPLGKFEDERYSRGTFEVARAIAESEAYSVIGGGESVEVLEALQLLDRIDFVSTGGGAMLSFLTEEDMPGLDALRIS
jgi:phosphoglycerate kinase